MVKFRQNMASMNSQILPAPPSLTKSLLAGFDAVSSKISIILFSVVLDLFLWMGPRLPLRSLIVSITDQLPVMTNRQMLLDISERLNLMGSLRSYPIGIPSLMANQGSLPQPVFEGWFFSVPTWTTAVALWIGLTLIGILFGTMYFSLLSTAAIRRTIDFKAMFSRLPWDFWQIVKLTLLMFAAVVGLSFPFICLLTVLGITGFSMGFLLLLPYLMVLIWFFFPLIFAPHGIFINRKSSWESIRDSATLVRWTFPASGLFVVAAVVINEGLNILWRVPSEKSWFHLIGITGHAFVSAGLIAASFVYYHEAGRWVQKTTQKIENPLIEGTK